MASNTVPPSSDQIPSLYLSDTFYTWFNNTNDLINKVNPIEVYSITADTTGYLSPIQKDGITLDDLGNGNYRIGYILPSAITGGHTFTQHIRFDNGLSGAVVNYVNGLSGEIQAVTTISGRSITSTVNGVANVESAVFSINGVVATTAGSMTLDATNIPNTVAGTGPEGTILSATGGGTGTYSVRTEMFTATPAEDQIAIRFRGTSGGTGGNSPGTVFGWDSTRGVCADYLVWLNAQNGDGSDGSTIGGLLFSNAGERYDVLGEGRLNIASEKAIEIASNINPSIKDSYHIAFTHQSDGSYNPSVASQDVYARMWNSGAPEYCGLSLGVNSEGLLTSGLDIRGPVYDKDGNASGSAGKVLVSNASSKVEWQDPPLTTSSTYMLPSSSSYGNTFSSTSSGFNLGDAARNSTALRLTSTGFSTSNGNVSAWDGKTVIVFMGFMFSESSGNDFTDVDILRNVSTTISAGGGSFSQVGIIGGRVDQGSNRCYLPGSFVYHAQQPAGGSLWVKFATNNAGDPTDENFRCSHYSVLVLG